MNMQPLLPNFRFKMLSVSIPLCMIKRNQMTLMKKKSNIQKLDQFYVAFKIKY